MTEVSIFAAVGFMIACALTKDFTTKVLAQLRRDVGRLNTDEQRTRQERDQAEVLRESAEALHNQATFDCQKFEAELGELAPLIEQVQEDLGRTEDGGEEAAQE